MPKRPDHPFEQLATLRDALPAGPEVATPKPAAGPARAVVRLERKGRSGKEATIVDKLGGDLELLERWCRDLKQALGCGGHVEGDAIVLQGDLRRRLPALLQARGVKKVIVG